MKALAILSAMRSAIVEVRNRTQVQGIQDYGCCNDDAQI